TAQQRAATLEQQINDHDAETTRLTDQRAELDRDLEGRRATRRETAQALARDTERVREARGHAETVAARRDALQATAGSATELRRSQLAVDQAAQRLTELQAEADTAREQAAQQLREAGHDPFADDDALRGAVLTDADRRQLEDQLTDRGIDQARHTDGMA